MLATGEDHRPFVLFGPDHLGALALTVLVAIGLVRLVRSDPAGRASTAVRFGLAALLLGATATTLLGWARQGRLQWLDLLPLHLCDLLIFVAVYALVTRNALAALLLACWALTCILPPLQATLARTTLPSCTLLRSVPTIIACSQRSSRVRRRQDPRQATRTRPASPCRQ